MPSALGRIRHICEAVANLKSTTDLQPFNIQHHPFYHAQTYNSNAISVQLYILVTCSILSKLPNFSYDGSLIARISHDESFISRTSHMKDLLYHEPSIMSYITRYKA